MSKTLIVLNPHAAGGRAGRMWEKLEPKLWNKLGELVIAVTQKPEDVAAHIEAAYRAGLTRVISIGGDGTNHSLVNALVEHNRQNPDTPPMVYGILPIGTGRDWARSLKIPFDAEEAADWIANAQPRAVDIGLATIGGTQDHFLNIASAGITGSVANRVDRVKQRRPWTFLKSTVETILSYRSAPMKISVDDEIWYTDPTYALVVANGTTFGHGMLVAPDAKIDDGLFDVILIEGMARIRALAALRMIYNGSHLRHPKVHMRRAKTVHIQSMTGDPIGLELDGEAATGQDFTFEMLPGQLQLLT